FGTQIRLHQASSAGEDKIRGGGCNDNKIKVRRSNTGVFQRGLRSLACQLTGCYTGIGKMALSYACTLSNPAIRGFDIAGSKFCGQLIIGDDSRRQTSTRTYYLCVRHNNFQTPDYEAVSDKSLESFAD